MKRSIWLVFCVALLAGALSLPAVSFAAGDGHLQMAAYQGATLKGVVGYQLRKMDQKLDKVEYYLKFDAPAKARYASAKVYLDAADQAHKQILDYQMGKFDAKHQHYVTVVKRLEELRAKVTALGKEAAGGGGASQSGAAATGSGQGGTPQVARLQGTVGARLGKIEQYLDQAEAEFNRNDLSPQDRYKGAKGYLTAADQEYRQLFLNESGKINVRHPHYLSVMARFGDLKTKVETFGRRLTASGSFSGSGQTSTIAETTGRSGLPVGLEIGLARVRNTSRDVIRLATTGTTAKYVQSGAKYEADGEHIKARLRVAVDEWVMVNKKYAGKFDRSNQLYRAVGTELAQARAAAKKFYAYHGLYGHQQSAAATAALKPKWHYPTTGMTSSVHKQNVGRIVWSKALIDSRAQERARLEQTFKITDRIYGRVYFADSLRNTPVFASGDRKPQENFRNSYEIKLLIDGRNVPVSFGVFMQHRMDDTPAKKWTTWQFNLNPNRPDPGFERNVRAAWEKATRKLAAGTHQVRFEIWGTLGQLRTKGPLAVGEFTLLVGEGQQLALAGTFPADTYRGSDLAQLKRQMAQALVGQVTRNPADIKGVAVLGNWRHGVYRDTKRPFRMITGAILWVDKDGDGACKYNSYNFISDSLGGNSWTPLRYRSFCTGCPQGEVKCR